MLVCFGDRRDPVADRIKGSRLRCRRAEFWTRYGTRSNRSGASSLPFSVRCDHPTTVARGCWRRQRRTWAAMRSEWATSSCRAPTSLGAVHAISPETGPDAADLGAAAPPPVVTRDIGRLQRRRQRFRALDQETGDPGRSHDRRATSNPVVAGGRRLGPPSPCRCAPDGRVPDREGQPCGVSLAGLPAAKMPPSRAALAAPDTLPPAAAAQPPTGGRAHHPAAAIILPRGRRRAATAGPDGHYGPLHTNP